MLKIEQLTDTLNSKKFNKLDILLITLSVQVDKPKSVKTIKELARNSGFTEVQKWNISDALKRSKGLAVRLTDGWSLTSRGRDHVQRLGVISPVPSAKVINHSEQLRKVAAAITDSDTKEFVGEAIAAYETGLYRSAVVLSWAGAVSLLYDNVMANHLSAFNIEATRRDSRWRNARIKDDLSRMKESDFLNIIGSPPISLIGKNLKDELINQSLRLRNSCGHPNSFIVGENKASAHLEVLIQNIFSKFT